MLVVVDSYDVDTFADIELRLLDDVTLMGVTDNVTLVSKWRDSAKSEVEHIFALLHIVYERGYYLQSLPWYASKGLHNMPSTCLWGEIRDFRSKAFNLW